MTLPNATETARRYLEAYEWNAAREQQGRRRMRTAKFIAVVVAVISGLLVFAGVASATKEGAAGMGAGAFFGVLVGFLLGAVFYQWWYNSGLRMVLSAQQMLVAIDTEHNTREIAETLRASG